MNKNRGIEKMMLMMKKMTERRMAIVQEICVFEGLTTVRSLSEEHNLEIRFQIIIDLFLLLDKFYFWLR